MRLVTGGFFYDDSHLRAAAWVAVTSVEDELVLPQDSDATLGACARNPNLPQGLLQDLAGNAFHTPSVAVAIIAAIAVVACALFDDGDGDTDDEDKGRLLYRRWHSR